MTKTRREFSPEFKREAVALLESSGRPQMQIAAELGIQPLMLRSWPAAQNAALWRAQAGQASATGLSAPLLADLASENAKLWREFERTRMERETLKVSACFRTLKTW
ncbi:transposase [Rubellimicrobium rubrum]|uniref:Transposase n=1 Tax=Rubellimicrobium rubrum TaxID=2585369 RepID=A0A5C4MWW8_9RHOB|nr:transposase [Rubellimicrobium rubrum]